MNGPDEPHYMACIRYLLEQHATEIRDGMAKGKSYGFETLHDDGCPALEGGNCNCNCVVNLIIVHDPEDN